MAPTPLAGTSRRARIIVAVLAAMAAALLAGPGPAPQAGALRSSDPTVAPVATLSPDGRSVTTGATTLAVSQAAGLNPAGQPVQVSGLGFDPAKGIYVALCVVPPDRRTAPGPCGGGADLSGQGGASRWISSNPPSYGAGLALPYGPGGSFSVTLTVGAVVAPGLDCRAVRCGIVTRNDHLRSADRSQDLIVPVQFGAAPAPAPPPAPAATAPPPPPTVATGRPPVSPAPNAPSGGAGPTSNPAPTVPVPTEPPPAPGSVPGRGDQQLSEDGRSATDGIRTLTVERTSDLDPTGHEMEITGSGFTQPIGVYVALCRLPDESGAAPEPCDGGAANRSRWVTPEPPDWAADTAVRPDADGTFRVRLELRAQLDDATDCRAVACAVTVRRDHVDPADRSADLWVPVSFADERPPGTGADVAEPDRPSLRTDATAARTGTGSGRSRGPWPWAALAVVGIGAGGATAASVLRRRRPAGMHADPAEGPAA